ncbi:transforming growth factor beta activator LRRC32 [Rhinophrynus dorsalis]
MLLYLILFLAMVKKGISTYRPPDISPCIMVNMAALCQNKSFQEIPWGLHSNIRTLDLSKNELQNITESPLVHYSSIELLDLSTNKISFIQPNTFENMVNLKEINLSDNYLHRFVQYGAEGIGLLPSVRKLELSRNSLYTDMTANFLRKTPKLQYLSLSENSITMITPETFLGSPLLREVDLHNNFIMNIEEGSFEHLKYLTILNLSMNSITCILNFNLRQLQSLNMSKNSIKIFHTTDSDEEYKLEYVDLSDNRLSYFPILPRVNNLISIDLSMNSISLEAQTDHEEMEWMNDHFQFEIQNEHPKNLTPVSLSKLTHLDLSYNSISLIPDDFFVTMPFLRFLNLSKNCIQTFSLGHSVTLNSLAVLDLSGNSIQNLSFAANSLPSLQELYLQNNQLQVLESRIFQGLMKIIKINLQGNNIRLCSASFGFAKRRIGDEYGCVAFFNITTLQNLNLRENMMHQIPQNAFYGSPLTSLDLSMNLGLTIKPNALSGLEGSLQLLSLENNAITWLNVNLPRFIHLTYLNLSGNQLTWLPPWNDDCHLQTLDLSHNGFSNLQVSNIPTLESTLKTLSVQGNPLSCCLNSWIVHMAQRNTVLITALNATTCNDSKAYEGEITFQQIRLELCEKDSNNINIIIILTLVLVLAVTAIGISLLCCFCRRKFNKKS